MTLISSNKTDNLICKRIPPEVIIKLSNIINSQFPYIPKLEEEDFEEPNDTQIRIVTDKLFSENDLIPENEINNLIKLLSQDTFRLKFIHLLTFFRQSSPPYYWLQRVG